MLKHNRNILDIDITKFCNQIVCRGSFVCYLGDDLVGIKNCREQAEYAGCILQDVVHIDTMRHFNFYRDEVMRGSKVIIVKSGWVVSNRITFKKVNVKNKIAYLGKHGKATYIKTPVKIGYFKSNVDSDGFVKIELVKVI